MGNLNAPEKQILRTALVFLVLGLLFRYLPWGIPAIGQVDEYSNLEYGAGQPLVQKYFVSRTPVDADKLTKVAADEYKPKSRKNRKNKQKKPNLPIRINHAGVEELCALKGCRHCRWIAALPVRGTTIKIELSTRGAQPTWKAEL